MSEPITNLERNLTNIKLINGHITPKFGETTINAYNHYKCCIYTANPTTHQLSPLFLSAPGEKHLDEWVRAAKENKTVYIYGADDMSPRTITFNGINNAPTVSEAPLDLSVAPPERSTGRQFLDAICEFFTGKKTVVGQQIQDKVDTYNFFKNRLDIREAERSDIKEAIVRERIDNFKSTPASSYNNSVEISNRLDRLMSATSTATPSDIAISERLVADKIDLPKGVTNAEFIALTLSTGIRYENLMNPDMPVSQVPSKAPANLSLDAEADSIFTRVTLIQNIFASGYDARIKNLTPSLLKARAQSAAIANEMSNGNYSNAGLVLREGLTQYLHDWNELTEKSTASSLAVGASMKKMLAAIDQNPELNKAAAIDPKIINDCRNIVKFSDFIISNHELANNLYAKQNIPNERIGETLKAIITNNLVINAVNRESIVRIDSISNKIRNEIVSRSTNEINAINSNTKLSPDEIDTAINKISNDSSNLSSKAISEATKNLSLPKTMTDYINNPNSIKNQLDPFVEQASEFKKLNNTSLQQHFSDLFSRGLFRFSDFCKVFEKQAQDVKSTDAPSKNPKQKDVKKDMAKDAGKKGKMMVKG